MSSAEQRNETAFPKYKDTSLSIDERVNDLISRMTLEEKINQMKYNAPAIDRLGVPEYNWWNECLHGVARAGIATVFPQSINLAASWDEELVFEVANAISNEARAKYNDFIKKGKTLIYQGLTCWAPNINIFRDPRWGRGHETYGEDPYLTGELGYRYVKGLQGDDEKYLKLVATPKHFAVHSGPEPERHVFDARVSERDLRDTYLPAFKKCIVEGKAYSVMCAYNRFMGLPCCGSDKLLQKILREEWKFNGYVVSDCWAVEDFYLHHKVSASPEEAVALAVKSGTDLNCGNCYPKLIEAVEKGLISESEIDTSVKRLFKARFLLGMFDPFDDVPFNKIPYEINNCQKHNELALEAARKSIVLLKNDLILPLQKEKLKVLVVGPNADDIDVLLGNYNGTPLNPVTVLTGIKNKIGADNVCYEKGCNIAKSILNFSPVPKGFFQTEDGESGLKGEYFNGSSAEGDPVYVTVDDSINFKWWASSPDSLVSNDLFSARWTGYFVPKKSGRYSFMLKEQENSKFYFDDKEALHFWQKKNEFIVDLVENHKYPIRFEHNAYMRGSCVQLLWAQEDENMESRAIEKAKDADVIIAVMGLTPRIEGEEMEIEIEGFHLGDRTDIELPTSQTEFLKKLKATGKPIILVLLNGGAIALNWEHENIPAIIHAGYPGQRGGDAIADVIFGDYNPAGRLPVTYYKSISQLPPFDDYNMQGHTYRYFKGTPLYPFGYGLSYTTFEYSKINLSAKEIKSGDNLNVKAVIKNIGDVEGEEVVQLYIKDIESRYDIPLISLRGFRRIKLKPGEKAQVEFLVTPQMLAVIDDENEQVVEPGEFELFIGGKLPDVSGSGDVKSAGFVSDRFTVTGDFFLIEG